MAPPRRRWFLDRPEEFDPPAPRLGSRSARDVAGETGGFAARLPSRSLASPLQRDRNTVSRPLLDFTSETAVTDRRRANGALAALHKGKLDASRGSSVMSGALAEIKNASSQRARAARAKPVGADNRYWSPTSGPKTYYGTYATIVPDARGGFRFRLPAHVVPCVARQTRKEVLFAKHKAGRASSRKPKRRGPYSNIGCR